MGGEPPGVLRTTSLPLVLQGLNKALKDGTRRAQGAMKSATSSQSEADECDAVVSPARHHDYMIPESVRTSSCGTQSPALEETHARRRGRKGKHRLDAVDAVPGAPLLSRGTSGSGSEKAWWLDVTSPTWEDMRTIGKVSLIIIFILPSFIFAHTTTAC